MSIFKKLSNSQVFANLSWMTIQKFVQILSSLVVGIVLARYLGASDYGIYSLLLALATILTTVSTFGLNHLITKEIKLSQRNSSEIVLNSIALRFLVSFLLIPVFYFIYRFVGEEEYALMVLIILFFQCFNSLKVVEFYFLSRSYMKPYVVVNVIVLSISVVTKIAMVFWQVELKYFLLLVGLDYVLGGLLSYYVYSRADRVKKSRWFNSEVFRELVSKGFPLALSSLTAVIYLKLDVIMLAHYVSKESVGHYAVASRLSEIWYILPGLVVTALFPKVLELKKESVFEYKRSIDQLLYFMVLISFALAIITTFLSDFIVLLLFGESYSPSADILQIHIWACIFIFMRAVVSKWLIAEDLYYLSLVTHGFGAVSNVILNFIMIPRLGGEGAAYATLISYGVASYLSLFFSRNGRPMAIRMSWALFLPSFFFRSKN